MATEPKPEDRRLWAVAMSASSVLTGPVLLGLLIDYLAGLMPWCTIAGVFLGMGGLFVQLVRLSQPKGPGA
jgi:F0F1-type ATP synthase assembly protein I